MAVRPIPEGYHVVTPYLFIRGAAKALEFYKEAFGAQELFRMPMPDGRIGHAEVRIGDSPVMLADEFPDMGVQSPDSLNGSSASFLIYVEDVDTVFRRALDAGATEVRPIRDQFYGDRSGTLRDPFGHLWTIATHVEDVPHDQLEKRMAEMAEKGEGCE